MNFRNLAYGVSAAAIMMSASTAVFAQETTGGIRGQVYDSAGQAVVGAAVTVVHVPSGTSSTTVTDATGGYNVRSLRVGGPYSVTVSSAEGTEVSGLSSIGIGAPASLDILISGSADASAAVVDDIVVTGARNTLRTSPTANFDLDSIETLPSISRDIRDFVRTSPFATVDPARQNALSIGGQNNRFNAILVDGTRQGDDFGLNDNGFPTVNSPISISVLEAVNVSVAPFDVQYGSFTGGVVNSVTKSGGNQFHGEAFYETTNEGLQGNTFAFDDFATGLQQNRTVGGEFEETTYGATLSGPIIKDKLFFLFNYEFFEATQPVLTGPEDSNATNPVPGITQAQIDQVRQIAQSVYGYDAMDWRADELKIEDEKYFAKIDWNINDRHRAAVSYQQTEGGDLRLAGSSTSTTYPAIGLLSSAYVYNTNLKNYRAQLFSDWTDTFSTELSVSYKETANITSNLGGDDFAAFQVYIDDPTGSTPRVGGERSIRFGPDRSRHANVLTVDTTSYRAVGNWDLGYGHRLKFGAEREEQDIFNLFVQVANAEYEFSSIANFQARIASSVGYSNAASNVKEDAAASFGYAQNTLFVQDTWQATDNLTLTAGVRFDWYDMDDQPLRNPAFYNRFGFENTGTLDGISVLQPRFGFNWKPTDSLTVYGGIGRYQGGSPNVWISNSYSNPGNLIGSFNCRVSSQYSSNFANSFSVCPNANYLNNVDGLNVNPLVQQQVTNSANLGTGQINLIDPAFETASIWKTSLGVTKRFDMTRWGMGEGWNVTAEYVHSELENAIGWVDLNLVKTQNGTAPDGRPTYGPNPNAASLQQVLMLTNFAGGETDQVAIALSKDWYDGLLEGAGFNLSYTHLNSTDPSAGTNSTASSNYANVASSAPNEAIASTSNYEIEDAIKLNMTYSRAFFGDYRTRFNLFGQRRSGLPFSYTFGASPAALFGETTTTQRQLLYVPATDSSGNVTLTSDPIVRYAAGFNIAGFNEYLQKTGLIDSAGKITERNGYNAPDVTTWDLHIAQELPAFFPGGARLEGYVDIENIGNLLNDEWGVIQQLNTPGFSSGIVAINCQPGRAPVTAANCVGGNGNYYQFQSYRDFTATSFNTGSVWQVKFGVRYKF